MNKALIRYVQFILLKLIRGKIDKSTHPKTNRPPICGLHFWSRLPSDGFAIERSKLIHLYTVKHGTLFGVIRLNLKGCPLREPV